MESEPALPLYIGLQIHALTRKRKLVDCLFALGISASYDHVMDIITSMGNQVSQYYQQIDVVCPPLLQPGQFVTAAIDNIDHNPSSTTATSSFHSWNMHISLPEPYS